MVIEAYIISYKLYLDSWSI